MHYKCWRGIVSGSPLRVLALVEPAQPLAPKLHARSKSASKAGSKPVSKRSLKSKPVAVRKYERKRAK